MAATTIAPRIPALARTTCIAALLIACFSAAHTSAQSAASAPAKPAIYSGCVQKAPNSTSLIISTPTACARLTGKVSASDSILAGHQVELTGILTPRTPSVAASIRVSAVSSVGKSCTDICALQPPRSRGLQRPTDDAVPGTEGGTPGMTTSPHP